MHRSSTWLEASNYCLCGHTATSSANATLQSPSDTERLPPSGSPALLTVSYPRRVNSWSCCKPGHQKHHSVSNMQDVPHCHCAACSKISWDGRKNYYRVWQCKVIRYIWYFQGHSYIGYWQIVIKIKPEYLWGEK